MEKGMHRKHGTRKGMDTQKTDCQNGEKEKYGHDTGTIVLEQKVKQGGTRQCQENTGTRQVYIRSELRLGTLGRGGTRTPKVVGPLEPEGCENESDNVKTGRGSCEVAPQNIVRK